jgi:hypothetical protein
MILITALPLEPSILETFLHYSFEHLAFVSRTIIFSKSMLLTAHTLLFAAEMEGMAAAAIDTGTSMVQIIEIGC